MEPTTIRLNIEGTDLTISVMVDREDQTISAVISDDSATWPTLRRASTYEQRRLGETLLEWIVDGADYSNS